MAALLFDRLAASNGDLVFGEDSDIIVGDVPVTVDLVLGGPAVDVHVAIPYPVYVDGPSLPGPTVSVAAEYVSGADRPLVAKTGSGWQAATAESARLGFAQQGGLHTTVGPDLTWQAGAPAAANVRVRAQHAVTTRTTAGLRHQQGRAAGRRTGFQHQVGLYRHSLAALRHQQGVPSGDDLSLRYQEALRDRRNRTAARWQEALRHWSHSHTGRVSDGLPLRHGRDVRYQEAWPPRPGRSLGPIVVPPEEPCYTPSGHMVFSALWDGSPNLVFVCDGHGEIDPPDATVVVPIKRVYVVLNTASLLKIAGSVLIPTFGMSLSLDCDSWTWSFSASIPLQAEADLLSDEPVEVEATINGVAYRFLVENLSRERAFNEIRLRATGRGKSALLDSPYAPVMSFGNDEARSAQQLMNDVLTLNGVPIGWEVDWGLTDWSVPAGVFQHQGSYIEAINAIAKAAGGYVQPSPVAQTLRVLHRYPVVPWEWASVTPDFELPSAVTTRETIEWVKRPVHNRVFVIGTQQGVHGQYTRTGTDGASLAPTVTDALITHADAVRQRGRVEIAQGGNSAMVGLRLPVLAETGIIPPGKWVRYVDGGVTRFGITRSVSVDVGRPDIFQTIAVETRV